MSKRVLILFCLSVITMSLIITTGCTHKLSSSDSLKNELMTSMGRPVSRAPAEFKLEDFAQPNVNPLNQMFFENSIGEKTDCTKVLTRHEEFNGKKYLRYNISDPDQLKCPQVKAMRTKRPWLVKKTSWTSSDELGYQKFIHDIGKSKCNTADRCLSGPSNPLRDELDMLNVYYTDCADLPYYLRAYYAYKNNLPMSFVLEITRNPFTESQQKEIERDRKAFNDRNDLDGLAKYEKQVNDLRYSRNGNQPVSRFNIPSSAGVARDFGAIAPQIVDIISSGFLRMSTAPENGLVQPDFYSPKVDRKSIVPGTVLYNVAGHVAVVYDVSDKGEIHFMDAHPDNSISRGTFNLDYKVLNSKYGGNFKNFRPMSLIEPVVVGDQITKAKPRFATDAEIPQFSLEQYNGDSVINGKGVFKLKASDKTAARFHDWVKTKLSGGSYRLDPIAEMKNEVDALCNDIGFRLNAVDDAINNKIHEMPHPENLPRNIFGAEGPWESYSSPGRDLRFRVRILTLPESAKDWLARSIAKDPLVSYQGSNLKADLITAYHSAAESCKVSYKNSAGQNTIVTLEQIIGRVSNMSFDPYMCPEIRWGANTEDELKTCLDDNSKKEWHRLTQFFRNSLEKDTTAVHGQSLNDLRQLDSSNMVNNKLTDEDYNIVKKLNAL
jgi:hypothetical protein